MSKIPILYHYAHCPFCVRVRLTFSFLSHDYKSIVLPYDEEKIPINLTAKKMLPIYQDETGAINESLEIIQKIDRDNKLSFQQYSSNAKEFDQLLDSLGNEVHNLAMPYWIYTPEFDEVSRNYFQLKKEVKRGPFNQLVLKRQKYEESLNIKLLSLEEKLKPFFNSDKFSILDVMLYSHLVGLYVVPGFQFSQKFYEYMKHIENMTNFSYHELFWQSNDPFYIKVRGLHE